LVSWQGHDLDFTGAIFSGGTVTFDGAEFGRTVNFYRASPRLTDPLQQPLSFIRSIQWTVGEAI
jgi:hypothetical protein